MGQCVKLSGPATGMVDTLSPVHTEETTGSPQAQISYGEQLRQNYPNEWPATADAYCAWDSEDFSDRLPRLENCRSDAWFAINVHDHTVRVISNACHLRWCPLCAQARANFLARSVRAWYYTAKQPKLLTLTLRHSNEPLEHQINHIYNAFRNLRRCKYMADRIRGGIWFFQITWSKTTNQWHPHLHALLDAQYIPKREIQARWNKYTEGSDIIDIRGCWSPESAANHVARYATRPGTLSSVPPTERLELLLTLHGRRIVGAWGSARKVPLAPPKSVDKDSWKYLGSFEQVFSQSAYNQNAKAIILAWRLGITVPGDIQIDHESFEPEPATWLQDSVGNDYYDQSLYDP